MARKNQQHRLSARRQEAALRRKSETNGWKLKEYDDTQEGKRKTAQLKKEFEVLKKVLGED